MIVLNNFQFEVMQAARLFVFNKCGNTLGRIQKLTTGFNSNRQFFI